MANPFYDSGSLYGGTDNLYTSPFVRDYLSQQTPTGEYERFLTDQGYGGFNRRDLFARSQAGRANAGFQAATLTNPFLTYRDYLNQNLGPGFFDSVWRGLTPSQRGENPSLWSGRSRIIGRA